MASPKRSRCRSLLRSKARFGTESGFWKANWWLSMLAVPRCTAESWAICCCRAGVENTVEIWGSFDLGAQLQIRVCRCCWLLLKLRKCIWKIVPPRWDIAQIGYESFRHRCRALYWLFVQPCCIIFRDGERRKGEEIRFMIVTLA